LPAPCARHGLIRSTSRPGKHSSSSRCPVRSLPRTPPTPRRTIDSLPTNHSGRRCRTQAAPERARRSPANADTEIRQPPPRSTRIRDVVGDSSRHHNWTLFAQRQTEETPMTTRKPGTMPQRTQRDTVQAGCREFESRPPLHSTRITALNSAREMATDRPPLENCARTVPESSCQRRGSADSLSSDWVAEHTGQPLVGGQDDCGQPAAHIGQSQLVADGFG
jgi:hypothetical protein